MSLGWPFGSDWLPGSLRGLNLLLRPTQGFRPGLNYVALRGLFFAVNCRRGGLTVRHRSSIECCGGRSSRFAFPTFRTGRERWGSRHFWLFEVLGLTPWAKFMSSFGAGVCLAGLDCGRMQRSPRQARGRLFVGSRALRARLRCLRMTAV